MRELFALFAILALFILLSMTATIGVGLIYPAWAHLIGAALLILSSAATLWIFISNFAEGDKK